jgi:hypothetical protein
MYIHYGSNQFDRRILEDKRSENANRVDWKPCGLWASPIDAGFGWKEWCEAGCFDGSDFSKAFRFDVAPNAKILHVRSLNDVAQYISKSPNEVLFHSGYYYLDCEKLCRDYDGIELHISDNYDELHMSRIFNTWDVDSICVWNPDAIVVEGGDIS